jgi:hypothetical protein
MRLTSSFFMANEYRQILFCYIFDQKTSSTIPRELDSGKFSTDQVWSVGRNPPTDDKHRMTHICLHSPFVSSLHAQLRYNEESASWEIRSVSRSNKTILDGIVMPECKWLEIHEGSKVVFATPENIIVFTYIKDDTLTPDPDPEQTIPIATSPEAPTKTIVVSPDLSPSMHEAPWQLQLITIAMGGASSLPLPRLALFLISVLIGLAIILLLGAAH